MQIAQALTLPLRPLEIEARSVVVDLKDGCAVFRAQGDPAGCGLRVAPDVRQLLTAQARGILACDFFTVETIRLKTLYVLFFIELGSRRVRAAQVTTHPDSAWVTQQARNLAITQDRPGPARFLIHDRDAKFSGPFDEVFRTGGAGVILTPVRAPKANAYAERWVETVRTECLDHVLVLGRRHLDRILRTYVDHYNQERPHRGLALAVPERPPVERVPVLPRDVRRRAVLGGLISEYHGAAA